MHGVPPYRWVQNIAAFAGNALLSAGDYWFATSVSAAPTVGSYTSTSVLSDGSAGDTTTRVTSDGDPMNAITVISVEASAISIATWAMTCKYQGDCTLAFSYWDGSAWQSLTDTNGVAFGNHKGYTDESRTATFSGAPSATIFRVVITESDVAGGGMSCSDSRAAA